MKNFNSKMQFSFNFGKKAEEKTASCFEIDSRYITPPETPKQDSAFIKYENAEKLARKIDCDKRTFVVVNGSFILGDFIEAFIVENDFHIKRMIISTLSLSENNVDSLKNLLEGEYIDQLDLLVSDYFFHSEADGHGNSLMPYIYQELDTDNRFQLAVSRSHTKATMFETHCGKKIVIHGSANLRSSANLEQIMIENNADLYDFLEKEIYQPIIDKYWTVDFSKGKKQTKKKEEQKPKRKR